MTSLQISTVILRAAVMGTFSGDGSAVVSGSVICVGRSLAGSSGEPFRA